MTAAATVDLCKPRRAGDAGGPAPAAAITRALCRADGPTAPADAAEKAFCYVLPLPDGDAPEWVMLMPAGELRARDGRRWRLHDAEAVVAETKRAAGATDLVFDYNHQTEFTEKNGQPAPASGWIKALEVRAGAIWGRVDWTDRAKAAIAAKEFRYVSPVFKHTRAGEVLHLLRAGLLNDPALEMPALAGANGGFMHEQLKRVLAKLGLKDDSKPTTAEAAAALARIDPTPPIGVAEMAGALGLAATAKAAEVLAAARTRGVELARALGLAETATGAEVLAAARAKAGTGDPDLTAFVPRAEFDRVAARLNAIETKTAADLATAAVDDAIRAGKLAPAQRDWGLASAKKDLDSFKAYAASAPVIVTPAALSQARPAAPDADAPLTAEEKAVCGQLGISEDGFGSRRRRRRPRWRHSRRARPAPGGKDASSRTSAYRPTR